MSDYKNIYTFKDKPYRIFSDTKIKINDDWVDGIIYECLYKHPNGRYFVRTKEEFFTRFKPIKDSNAFCKSECKRVCIMLNCQYAETKE